MFIFKCVIEEDNRHLTHGIWFRPHTSRLSLSELLDLSKTITGGNNSFNAPQISTLILGVLPGKKTCLEQHYVDVHLKNATDFCTFEYKNKSNLVKYHHLLSMGETTMVQKCVQWIILLLIEEDQNKSSANLFSGLRSGGRVNETQLSYLLYHSKSIPSDSDDWIAVKWYPFMTFLNV